MIRSTTLGLFAFALSALAAVAAPAVDRADDVQAIREHIDSIFNAYRDKDAETVRATHSSDWRGFLRRTPTIVRGIEEYMEEANRSLRGPGGLTGYDMLEFDVAFHAEDFAVVSYIADMHVGLGEVRGTIKLRVLDVYAKRSGGWIQVASNTTTHPESLGYMRPVPPRVREELLAARDAVWRAYFEHDREELERLLPEGTLAIGATASEWSGRTGILAASKGFVEGGGRLVGLDFPRTEIQLYGENTAVVYTSYRLEIEVDGDALEFSGRGTEIFTREAGAWRNSGWHLDAGPVAVGSSD